MIPLELPKVHLFYATVFFWYHHGHLVSGCFGPSKMYFWLLLKELQIPKGSISNIIIETHAVMELKWILTRITLKRKA